MPSDAFMKRLSALKERHQRIITKPNSPDPDWDNGIWTRYVNPVLTDEHAPIHWRYDLDENSNPRLLERLGINAVMNSGAIYKDGTFIMMTRTEGYDRKSIFCLAESANGIDNWQFVGKPIVIPHSPVDPPDTNTYDMRLVPHEDGWIYGQFCAERRPEGAPPHDQSAAHADAGLCRTRDLVTWERLPNLRTPSSQQRNVVLHPELVNGKYLFYTRPMDGFIDTGTGSGICYGFCDDMSKPEISEERIVEGRRYHTINEVKNGQGPAPIKTDKGWLHCAHGVRNTAAGLRYVLYMLVTDLNEPWKVIARPGGHVLGPRGIERVGDVSNVLFTNGWAVRNEEVFLYYASCDTRMHVATSTIDTLLDYCFNTPEDALTSHDCAIQRGELIDKNLTIMKDLGL
ncbi:MAG: glycosidase [Planctomycetota bacterium]